MKEESLFIILFSVGWMLVVVLIGVLYSLLTKYFTKQSEKLDSVALTLTDFITKNTEQRNTCFLSFASQEDVESVEKRVTQVEREMIEVRSKLGLANRKDDKKHD